MMFRRDGDAIEVRIPARDREVIGQIPELLASITADPHGAAHAVLNRPAMPDDPEASRSLADLVEGDMARQREEDRAVVSAVAGGRPSMTRDEALGFLRSINEARLALAARSGILDQGPGWEEDIALDRVAATVAWLGWVEGELLRTLVLQDR